MPCSLESLSNTKIRGSKWFKVFQKVHMFTCHFQTRHVKALIHFSEQGPAASWLLLSDGHLALVKALKLKLLTVEQC